MSGCAISQSSATSPLRRAPSSATTTSVAGGAPRSVIGRPISLLNEAGLAWVRYAPRQHRGGHVLRAGLAVRAGDRRPRSPTSGARSAAASRSSASPVERPRRAGPVDAGARRGTSDRGRAARERILDEARPVGRARPGGRRTARPGHDVASRSPRAMTSASAPTRRPPTSRATSDSGRGITPAPPARGAPRGRPPGRRTSTVRSAISWAGSWPLPAITTTSPGRGLAERQRDRGPAVGLRSR